MAENLFKIMRILITGGAGFIGSNLSAFHLKNNDSVTVIDNLITGSKENIKPFLNNNNFTFYQENILTFDFGLLTSDFDIVYHLASPASPIQYKKYPIETLLVNSEGTQKLLEFMKKSNSKSFVLASTSEIYGDPLVHPQIETYWGNVNPVGIRSCYDEGKRFAEAITMTYFRKYKLNVRIARIFNTYGPHMDKDDGRVTSNIIYQAITNKPLSIYGNGKQTRSFCYVSDLVNGLYKLATTADIEGEVINLGNSTEYSILDFTHIVQELTGTISKIIYQQIDEDDPKRRKPDITKAKTKLNWEPIISLKDGLLNTISYFKKRFL